MTGEGVEETSGSSPPHLVALAQRSESPPHPAQADRQRARSSNHVFRRFFATFGLLIALLGLAALAVGIAQVVEAEEVRLRLLLLLGGAGALAALGPCMARHGAEPAGCKRPLR